MNIYDIYKFWYKFLGCTKLKFKLTGQNDYFGLWHLELFEYDWRSKVSLTYIDEQDPANDRSSLIRLSLAAQPDIDNWFGLIPDTLII